MAQHSRPWFYQVQTSPPRARVMRGGDAQAVDTGGVLTGRVTKRKTEPRTPRTAVHLPPEVWEGITEQMNIKDLLSLLESVYASHAYGTPHAVARPVLESPTQEGNGRQEAALARARKQRDLQGLKSTSLAYDCYRTALWKKVATDWLDVTTLEQAVIFARVDKASHLDGLVVLPVLHLELSGSDLQGLQEQLCKHLRVPVLHCARLELLWHTNRLAPQTIDHRLLSLKLAYAAKFLVQTLHPALSNPQSFHLHLHSDALQLKVLVYQAYMGFEQAGQASRPVTSLFRLINQLDVSLLDVADRESVEAVDNFDMARYAGAVLLPHLWKFRMCRCGPTNPGTLHTVRYDPGVLLLLNSLAMSGRSLRLVELADTVDHILPLDDPGDVTPAMGTTIAKMLQLLEEEATVTGQEFRNLHAIQYDLSVQLSSTADHNLAYLNDLLCEFYGIFRDLEAYKSSYSVHAPIPNHLVTVYLRLPADKSALPLDRLVNKWKSSVQKNDYHPTIRDHRILRQVNFVLVGPLDPSMLGIPGHPCPLRVLHDTLEEWQGAASLWWEPCPQAMQKGGFGQYAGIPLQLTKENIADFFLEPTHDFNAATLSWFARHLRPSPSQLPINGLQHRNQIWRDQLI